MPHRELARRYALWLQKNYLFVLTGLLILCVGLAILAGDGYVKARDAQQRVNSLEFRNAQEDIGKAIADVATCFNRSVRGPVAIEVFRSLANGIPDQMKRLDAHAFIDEYEREVPSQADCVALAKKSGVDPAPYVNGTEPDGVGGEGR